ncbi:ABC transporter ATP-binding protein [Acidobacteria bacterium AH-259-G07]|nr:ABC transporter ATP-binding protein [Acidobacteria bacterium AH-259-G07]
MSDIAIKAESLSKEYFIGQTNVAYSTLRDTIVSAVSSPFKKAKALMKGHAYGAANLQESIWALKTISFEVNKGEVVGIIGQNGAGKTTLLKILSRITEPTEGKVRIYGRVGALLEVGTGFHSELTGRENIYLNGAILGMRKFEIDQKFDEIVAFAEIEKFMDTPVKFYSSGMYVRLAFAVAAHLEPEILLVDEVLAVGDVAFQKKCLGKMEDVAKEGRTVLFVSHRMGAIRNLCSRAIMLNQGHIELSGSVEKVVHEYLTFAYKKDSAFTSQVEEYEGSRDKDVRIVGFQARAIDAKGGHPRTGVGAEFLIDYAGRARKRVGRLYVGIAVKDILDSGVFFCSTNMKRSDFYDAPPRGRVICKIDSLPLVPGRYRVDIKLIDHETGGGYMAASASFDVGDSVDSGVNRYASHKFGNIIAPHEWMLKELEEAET